MDVILRNDPHVMDFNEYWNADDVYTTFVMEGSIIDGLKRLWRAFLNLLKRIKQRLQYTFNSEARTYRKVVQGLKIPSVVAEWKETRCPKWDYSVLKELLAKGIELCDCILSIEDAFENVEVADGHATWTPSELSKLVNNNNAIIKINGELKAITAKKQQVPVEKGQTVYDLATEWVEIYELVVRYYMRHDNVIEFTKEMDKIVKSLPENQATVTTKLMQNWITGLSYLHNAETAGPTGAMINARVDSRNGFVQIKTMLDENSKLLEESLKTVREANANSDKAIRDTEKFMRNNKNVLKNYAPWKEYYTKGMSDMRESYEYDELDELNAYIEATVNDLHEAMELRNELIQESDDDTVEDFEESDDNFTDEYEEADKKTGDLIADEIYRGTKFGQRYGSSLDYKNPKARENFRKFRDAAINSPVDKIKFRETVLNEKGGTLKDWEKLNKYADEFEARIPNKTKRGGKIYRDKYRIPKDKDYEEYYSDAIIRNYDEPVEEETTYCLRSNDMFTESYDDESYEPNRFHQEGFIRSIQMAIDTAATINLTAQVFVIVGAINTICTSLIYEKRLGRFPSEMKRVMDIIKKSKDGTVNTEDLYSALGDLKHATKTIVGQNAISLKAKKNFTQTEREEMKKMIKIISDLENMLTSKKYQAAERRVAARIEDFVTQAEKVMKLINRGRNEGDVVKEYMS